MAPLSVPLVITGFDSQPGGKREKSSRKTSARAHSLASPRAEAERIKLQREADAYKIQHAGEGEAERLARIEEARGLIEKNRKEAQGLLAKAEALAKQGRWVVTEALAEKLGKVQIEVVPYQKSEAPARLELESGLAPASGPAAPGQPVSASGPRRGR